MSTSRSIFRKSDYSVFIVPSSNLFPKQSIMAFPRVLKHLCAVAQSFLKEKVRGNALHTTQCLKKEWCAEMQMRNASEILRNAGGLGESISQNSLRVLPDFLAGILAGRTTMKNKKFFVILILICFKLLKLK